MKKQWMIGALLLWPTFSLSAEAAAASPAGGLYAVGAAIAIALAAVGGAIGQGLIGASAMEGLARNPQAQKSMFVSFILGLVFIESIMIYAFVTSLMIIGKF